MGREPARSWTLQAMNLARRPAAFSAVLLTAGALGAGVALAATDAPDPSFNGGAPLTLDLPGDSRDHVKQLALGPDGSVALLADDDYFPHRALLGRVSAAGAPVDAFGDQGVLEDPIPDMTGFWGVEDIAVDRDDRVLIGLETGAEVPPPLERALWGTDDGQTDGDFTVIRYAADGTRDGVSRLDVSPVDEATLTAVIPQADGGVLLAGTVTDYGEGDELVRKAIIVRLNADGTRDTSFGEDGAATIPGAEVVGADAQRGGPAGSVVVVAQDVASREIVMRRVLADGSFDAGYGGTFPWPSEQPGDVLRRVAVGLDGRVYVFTPTGMTSGDVGRYTADGQPDTAWADDGIFSLSDALLYEPGLGHLLAGDAEGRLLVTGIDPRGDGVPVGAVARVSGDGSGLDPTFGTDGVLALPVPDGAEAAYGSAIGIQDDGRIVVAGDFGASVYGTGGSRLRALEPEERQAFVLRLSATGTTTTPTETTTTTTTTQTTATPPPAATPAAPVVAAGGPAKPAAKACVSRRSFKIRLRIPHGKQAVSAVVRVDGKQVKVIRGSRLKAAVDLKGLPKGRFTVSITVKLTGGKTLKGTRRYLTCAAKKDGTIPVL
jgi:uncharacterized delta-60 repeat protein